MNDSSRSPEVRQNAMICHLSALLGIIIPFASVLGPLVFWQVKKESDAFIDEQGKEALNFQLNALVLAIVLFVLVRVPVLGGLFMLLLLTLAIGAFGLAVYAAVEINKGRDWRYPLPILRLVK